MGSVGRRRGGAHPYEYVQLCILTYIKKAYSDDTSGALDDGVWYYRSQEKGFCLNFGSFIFTRNKTKKFVNPQ